MRIRYPYESTYTKDMNAKEILNKLTLDDYEKIFHALGVQEIKKHNEFWILPTLCHNIDIESASYKLYFYLNTRSTFCFTECQKNRDIISLISDRWTLEGKDFKFPDILAYICNICGITKDDSYNQPTNPQSWKSRLSIYQDIKNSHYLGKRYDKDILKFLKPYYHDAFLNDGISKETMEKFGIGFYPTKNQITIPVYDLNGELVGIHCRNLTINDKRTPKYIPLHTISDLDYRFKQHEVLYGLNMNLPYIKYKKEIQLFESPKAVLQLDSMYTQNTGVGMFGLNLNKQRRDMILELGVKEVIVGVDRDFIDVYDDSQVDFTPEYIAYRNNVIKIAKLFNGYCKVSCMYDGESKLLGYKDSPTDRGKEIYERLYNNRMVINI